MKIDKLVLASHNKKKAAELQSLLEPLGITILSADEAGVPDVEETGTTFVDNANLKSVSACKHSGLPALADDSGLCVDALNGEPGVYTKRYCEDYSRLLNEIKNVPFGQRGAQFKCVLSLALPNEEPMTFEGSVDGFILTEPRGQQGFAYDPVFLPEGEQLSFGEMLPEQKNTISHRYRALQKLYSYLEQ